MGILDKFLEEMEKGEENPREDTFLEDEDEWLDEDEVESDWFTSDNFEHKAMLHGYVKIEELEWEKEQQRYLLDTLCSQTYKEKRIVKRIVKLREYIAEQKGYDLISLSDLLDDEDEKRLLEVDVLMQMELNLELLEKEIFLFLEREKSVLDVILRGKTDRGRTLYYNPTEDGPTYIEKEEFIEKIKLIGERKDEDDDE